MRKKKWMMISCLLAGMLCVLGGCAKEAKEQPYDENRKVKEDDTKRSVNITMAGDVLIEAPNYTAMDASYSFGSYFDKIRPYLKGDLVIGNQEVPIGGVELGITGEDYRFNSPKEIAGQMKDLGFDVMTFSNNHAYDRGMEGIRNTNENLKNAGLLTTGSFGSEKERKPLIVKRNGIRIAILAYTYDTNQYIPEEESFAVNTFLNDNHEFDEAHRQQIEADVKQAQKESDALIVAMHWGTEFTYDLNPQQMEAAQFLNELGVNIIIGNHPHTLQSVDTLVNAQGEKTFVMYSLGNFVSGAANVDRASEAFTNMYEVGGIVNLDLVFDTKSKEVEIKNQKLTPIVNQFNDGYQNFQLLPFDQYNEELASQHYQRYFSDQYTYAFLKSQLEYLFDGKIEWHE